MEPSSNTYFTLITGASSGIGKAIAEECSRRKMNLFLIALPGSGLEGVVQKLESTYNNRIHFLCIDLTKRNSPQKVYDYARSANLSINMLINNAGIGHLGVFENQDSKTIDDIILLNIRATTHLTRVFIKDLLQQPAAYILNVSSFLAFVPSPFKCVYGASKSYLLYFSRSLRLELKNTNVKVSSLHPSGVATNQKITDDLKNNAFYARITVLTAPQVAKLAIENLYKGKDHIIPGFFSRFFFWFGFFLPYGLVLNMMYNIFCKKNEKFYLAP